MSPAAWWTRFAEASLAWRLAAAIGLFGLVVAGAAAAFGYWGLSRQLDARLHAELEGKRSLLLHVLSEVPSVEQIGAHQHRFGDLLIGHQELHLAILERHSARVLASFSSAAAESAAQVDAAMQRALRWSSPDGKRYVSIAGPAAVRDGQTVRVVLSLDLNEDRQLMSGYVGAVMFTLPVLLMLVMLGAWFVARTGLAPLKRLTAVASRVTTHNLAQRLEPRGLPTELRALAEGFNAMLDRIDAGVQRLSEFSADLAHEMRTPVATLLGRTQVALSQPRPAGELQEVLGGNVEELDRLTRLIADMLFLARADQGDAVLARVDVDLGIEATRVAEYLAVVAEERGVQVQVTGSASVQADRLLVQRAITNLLTNAIRHADVPSVVSVAVRSDAAGACVDVSNRGAGIPPQLIGRVFERFVRLDAARARDDGAGTGLGLTIVRSVMLAHGGAVRATSEAGGVTTFSLVFARDCSDPAAAAKARPS